MELHRELGSKILCVAELQRQMMTLQQGGPWVQARNFAVFSGVSAGITVAMRRFRNKEDIRNVYVSLPAILSCWGADGGSGTVGLAYSTGRLCSSQSFLDSSFPQRKLSLQCWPVLSHSNAIFVVVSAFQPSLQYVHVTPQKPPCEPSSRPHIDQRWACGTAGWWLDLGLAPHLL